MNNIRIFEKYDCVLLRNIFNKLENDLLSIMDKPIQMFREEYGDNLMVTTSYTLDENRMIPVCEEEDISNNTIYNVKILKSNSSISNIINKEGIFEKMQEEEYVFNILKSIRNVVFFTIRYNDVTVENELGISTFIKELFVVIPFMVDRKRRTFKISGPDMLRAKYTIEHFTNKYMFSHAPVLSKSNRRCLHRLCLGTGPLGSFINSFNLDIDTVYNIDKIDGYDEFIEDSMRVLMINIDRYVTIESIKGGPYIRLENAKILPTEKNGNKISDSISVIHFSNTSFGASGIDIFKYMYKKYLTLSRMIISNIADSDILKGGFTNVSGISVVIKNKKIKNRYNTNEVMEKFTNIFKSTLIEYCMMTDTDAKSLINEFLEKEIFRMYNKGENGHLYISNNDNIVKSIERYNNMINDFNGCEILTFNGEKVIGECSNIDIDDYKLASSIMYVNHIVVFSILRIIKNFI